MGTYLTIMVGPRPDLARPVVASSDAVVVAAAVQAILDRINRPAQVAELTDIGRDIGGSEFEVTNEGSA